MRYKISFSTFPKWKNVKKTCLRFLTNTIFLAAILVVAVLAVLVLLFMNNKNKAKATVYCDGVVCDINSGDNKDVIISGGTAIMSGTHTFKSLTIRSGGVLTHDKILTTDIDTTKAPTDPAYLKASGQIKKIDLTITGSLIITDGSIDVSGKGFPGGQVQNEDGYGPGLGASHSSNSSQEGGGGGGYGGAGGRGFQWSTVGAAGGAAYGSSANPTAYGSGGGSSQWKTVSDGLAVGGNGGGFIRINASSVDMSANGFIRANGDDGGRSDSISLSGGGAGAGGSINITITDTLYTLISSSKSPTALGGTSTLASSATDDGTHKGGNGTVTFQGSSKHTYGNITANGGDSVYGGAGGGGRILLNVADVQSTCNITASQTSIPDTCENRDVTISGGGTVYADAIKIKQSTGALCTDQTDPDCDTKRHFRSLVISGNSVLTHSPILASELILSSSQDTDGDGSLADETTGTARWKKVDLVVEGRITLQSGGKIDVSEKGYPGAFFSPDNTLTILKTGYREGDSQTGFNRGCDGNTMGYLTGAQGVSARSDTAFRKNFGFGPKVGSNYSGGAAFNEYDGSAGGGGGFGGNGKVGTGDSTGSKKYNFMSGLGQEWGAGGGAASHDGSGADTACANGGNGGGKVALSAGSIRFSSISSGIFADGGQGFMFQDDSNSVNAGGGAGGSIVLYTTSIIYDMTSLNDVNVEGGLFNGGEGIFQVNGVSGSQFQMSVRGGDRSEHNRPEDGRGGGGGWIVINPTAPSAPTIKKIVEPLNRGTSPACNLTTNVNCFNPYSLQINDKVRIRLYITNLVPSSTNTISDELYRSTSNRQFCEPISGATSYAPVNDGYANNTIKWNIASDATGTIDNLYYDCLMKSY